MEGDGLVRVAVGRDGVGEGARDENAELAHGDGEAVDDDAADHEEPDHDVHDFLQVRGVGALGAIFDGDFLQEVDADVEVEDGADADGPKEADEKRLAELLDLVNVLMHGHNYRETA